jgi:hypothetical protein
MKPFRVLFLLTALLATAGAVHAQIPPAYFPYPLEDVKEAAPQGCPAGAAPTWYIQALQDSAATWQRLRSMCSTGGATCQQAPACCDPPSAKGAGCCALGLAGNVKCCETDQAPKACGCVKACACCESCKAKKDATAQVPAWNPFGVVRLQYNPTRPAQLPAPGEAAPTYVPGLTSAGTLTPDLQFPGMGTPACLPPQCVPGIVQVVPAQGVRAGFVRVVQVAHHVQPAHLVTPDLDAHCERMHHRGDMVVLEGNVLLLCKKHAQPLRIEAQRVLVNMRDGSFTVESATSLGVSGTFGLERMPLQQMPSVLMPHK